MNGGPSHVDTFDPKPMLDRHNGKPVPTNLPTERKTGAAMGSPFRFKKYGQSGIEVSDLFAHTAGMIDDICVIRSMHADVPNHEPSLMLMNCGEARQARPCVGSWVLYGLGTENQNLPGFIVMCPGGFPIAESQNWQSAFLPGIFQGTYIDSRHTEIDKLIAHIRNHGVGPQAQRAAARSARASSTGGISTSSGHEAELETRIQSFELAYRMQSEAADAFDISQEPEIDPAMYGPGVHARQLLATRRLLERGVRFVQLWHGDGQPWDHHDDLATGHRELANAVRPADRGVSRGPQTARNARRHAGDLGRRVRPYADRRAAHSRLEPGEDERPRPQPLRLHDVDGRRRRQGGLRPRRHRRPRLPGRREEGPRPRPARHRCFYLLGFDHEQFTYRYAGRDFRLTDVHGTVVKDNPGCRPDAGYS